MKPSTRQRCQMLCRWGSSFKTALFRFTSAVLSGKLPLRTFGWALIAAAVLFILGCRFLLRVYQARGVRRQVAAAADPPGGIPSVAAAHPSAAVAPISFLRRLLVLLHHPLLKQFPRNPHVSSFCTLCPAPSSPRCSHDSHSTKTEPASRWKRQTKEQRADNEAGRTLAYTILPILSCTYSFLVHSPSSIPRTSAASLFRLLDLLPFAFCSTKIRIHNRPLRTPRSFPLDRRECFSASAIATPFRLVPEQTVSRLRCTARKQKTRR